MLSNNRISAVLVSTNLDKSRDFYENKLGLPLSSQTIKNHLVFECGNGTTIVIYGRGAGNKGDHTQVRFWTSDVDADVKALVERGVVFDDYDSPTFKTVNHVATSPGIGKSAWFKDPDGNTLALFQPE
jgi:catechol 2,3-dioxygenase-like lactoylglutathione lyase family enzyme